jgi:hypothetical protein
LVELHHRLPSATIVYRDNINAVYVAANPVQQRRTGRMAHTSDIKLIKTDTTLDLRKKGRLAMWC